MILPDTDLNGAAKVAEEMLLAIKDSAIEHAKSKVTDIVSISIGVSPVIPQRDTNPEALISAADQALYRAKEDGRDRVKSGEVAVASD